MKKALLISTLPLLITGCLRFSSPEPGTYHIQGRVLAHGTNEPIEGAVVYASDCDGVEYLGDDCKYVLLDSTTTDAQGRYEFTVTGWTVIVGATKPNYDSRNTSELVNGYSGEKTIDVILQPYAWLDVKVTNKSGAPRAIFAVMYTQDLFLKKDSSFHFFTKVGGNDSTKVGLAITDWDGKLTNVIHRVYCKGLDTTYHSIEY